MIMPETIPHNCPSISEDDIQAVAGSLMTRWLAEGASVERFEEALCSYLFPTTVTDHPESVAVSSGSAALFLALYALDIGTGDEVIVPTYSCSALLNAVYLVGAKPVVVDVDSKTWNLSFDGSRLAISSRTKAIILTHTFGVPADVDEFLCLGPPVVEDCAQGIGTSLRRRKVGTIGHISVFSFYATKMITTGQGGMVVSTDSTLVRKARDYREFDSRKEYYPRFNFQTTDFQAVLGLSQLSRIDSFIARRKSFAQQYQSAVSEYAEMKSQGTIAQSTPNYYRFVINLAHPDRLGKWIQAFESRGIRCACPIERHELLHRYLGLNPALYPNAERLAKQTISLPVFPSMNDMQVQRVLSALQKLLLKESDKL